MHWRQGAQNTGLSSAKVHRVITMHVRPDRQTDKHHDTSATIHSNERTTR